MTALKFWIVCAMLILTFNGKKAILVVLFFCLFFVLFSRKCNKLPKLFFFTLFYDRSFDSDAISKEDY